MFGWHQKVQQAPQGIPPITAVYDLEELAEESGGGSLEGRVQHRQQVLDRAFQRIRVLKTQERKQGLNKSSARHPTGSLMIPTASFTGNPGYDLWVLYTVDVHHSELPTRDSGYNGQMLEKVTLF